MNLLFRLLWISVCSRYRSKVSIMGPCLTPFRCLPSDLDVLRHMNNGKYFSLMDLARVDLMIRAGLLSKLKNEEFYPVVVAETMRFQKSIKLLQTFDIETVVLGWDEKAFVLRQRFMSNDVIVAEAIVRARFLKKSGGSVPPSEIIAIAKLNIPSPPLDPWILEWNSRQAGKSLIA